MSSHCAVSADDFIALAVPSIHLILVVEFEDFAELVDVFNSTKNFKASDRACVSLDK